MNIQNTIITCIYQQLFYNDYLVIPGFGGFVLRACPARLAYNNTVVLPPGKTLSYNAQLKQNDGVLILALQKKLNCTPEVATGHIYDFAAYCNGILNSAKRITFDNIGLFYSDFEGNICFEPFVNANFLTSSFGFGTIALKEIEPETDLPQKNIVFNDRLPEKTPVEVLAKSKRKRKYVLPSLIGLGVFSLLALFIYNTKLTGPLKASLFGNNLKSLYSPVTYGNLSLSPMLTPNIIYVADINGVASFNLNNGKTLYVNTSKTESVLPKKESPAIIHTPTQNKVLTSQNTNYKIVLGCFSVFENAERLKRTLIKQQITAEVYGTKKGLFIVSTGNFSTKEDAASQLLQIRPQYPDAWIKNPD